MKVSCITPKQSKSHCIILGVTTVGDEKSVPSLELIGEKDHQYVPMYLNSETLNLGFGATYDTPGKNALLVLLGLGDPSKLTQEKLGTAMAKGLAHAKKLAGDNVETTILMDAAVEGGLSNVELAQAATQGAICGDFSFDQWKSKPKGKDAKKPKPEIKSLKFIHNKPASIRKAVNDAAIIAEAVNDARIIANTPANIATPKWMATQARSRGRKHGYKVSVKGRKQLREEGFNLLCGVAQGSANEEQLITMDWNPKGAKKTLVVVGKGVTFDSGGISLKPGNGMWDMKYDKCGASNVIAMMAAVAQLGIKHRVIGITPCVENMPSSTAQRPGDIVTAKDGTTVEILNTDAEGRLILGDSITYARDFDPDWIIEMSTLTGACEFAVGKTYVAAMSKDDEFVDAVVAASRRAGDKAWKLPQGEEFDNGNKATYADLQNISLSVKAGTSIGGAFVAHFAKDTKFCHLDIASKAWVDGQDYFGKGPTGAGLRIALEMLRSE